MMRALTTCLALGATAFLVACSGGTDQGNTQAAQLATIYQQVRSNRQASAAPLPTLTPQLIAGLTVPSLEVTIEERGATAFLIPFSDRRDSGPGDLRTWRTANNVMVVLRNGVLVATRGVGNDLGSADADAAAAAVARRSPISGLHTLFYKNGTNGISTVDLLCEMRTVGSETIQIVGSSHNVVHLQENCTGTRGIITYDYWVDRRDSTVWQSRQWGGPDLGYIRTRLLKK
ncbi:MAG: YjbF family lipoprotein [Pseudomonadota bacterium]